jgi:hypothetical protein
MGVTTDERMFARITDFAFARNAKQALGFYLFHLAIGVVGFMLAVVCYKLLAGLDNGPDTVYFLSRVSSALAMFYTGYLSYKLLAAKGLTSQIKLWLAAAFGVGLGVAGMLLALVVPACLSILRPTAAAGHHLPEEEQP